MTEKKDLNTTSGTCASESAGKPFLAAVTPEQLSDFIRESGESPYRAGQIYNWIKKGLPIIKVGKITFIEEEELYKFIKKG